MLCKKFLKLYEDNFHKDQIILTSNRRLANCLLQAHDDIKILKKQNAWARPPIYPLTDWLEMLWKKLGTKYRVLNEFQEIKLWETIIEESQLSLINLQNTAKLAQSAWQTLHLWNIPLATINKPMNNEIDYFLKWVRQFQKIGEQLNVITLSQLPNQLLQFDQELPSILSKKILLSGFDELAPVYQDFFSRLSPHCSYEFFHFDNPVESIHAIQCANEQEEIETMARWAKAQLAKKPEIKIACIIPELHRQRKQIERIFTEIFCHETMIVPNNEKKNQFNFSAGQALMEFDLIHDAHAILMLMTGKLDLQKNALLFQSPYLLLNDSDRSLGALLDLRCRAYSENNLPLYAVFSPLEILVKQYPRSTWLRRCQALLNLNKQLPKQARCSQWANYFIDYLKTAAWPGSRSLNSLEYQLVKRWEKLLLEYASLDFLGEISLFKALSLLKEISTHTIFQPQGQANAPIQILGVLESAGCYFDHAWIMGLHHDIWPPPAKPNPFIPYALQVAHKMPHANANRELEYTKTLSDRLFKTANVIMVSSAKQQEDRDLQSSQFISSLKKTTLETLHLPTDHDYVNQIFQSANTETLRDDQGLAVKQEEHLSGGSGIIKEQSLCPFRAFSIYRLHASPLETSSFGLSPSTRGTLLHQALEKIWREIKDHQTLTSLNETELFNKIDHVSSTVINDFSQKSLFFPSKKILHLEKIRLNQLISKWLATEKKRLPFNVVQREKRHQIKINQLPLSIQIDRIDQLSDGSEIIIDYKTSDPSIVDWFGDRPKEPQLPLYCVLGNNNKHYDGITFAVIRANKMAFKGMMRDVKMASLHFPGVISIHQLQKKMQTQQWENITHHWTLTIKKIADDFCNGQAKVDPIDTNICQYCHLHSLCRILEQ